MKRRSNHSDEKSVLVIGCGNLGRWHIKGLETSKDDILVDVVDTSQKSIDELKKAITLGIIDGQKVQVSDWSSLEKCSDGPRKNYDLVIVATLAAARARLVEYVCSKFDFNGIILEKPMEQSVSNIDIIDKALSGRAAYVNHARRLMPWHQQIKRLIGGASPVELYFNYSSLRIACNMSHLIDLVNWWTGEVPKEVDLTGLENKWFPTKRQGFWEVKGKVKIKFNNGSMLVVNDNTEPKNQSKFIISRDKKVLLTIDEAKGVAQFSNGEVLHGNVLPQSKLTGGALDSLLEIGSCALPTVSASAACNRLFTSTLFAHWRKYGDETLYQYPPIT